MKSEDTTQVDNKLTATIALTKSKSDMLQHKESAALVGKV